ncbi:hypothetical protein [Sporolactobacillus inulinus]|uniref:Uncharacterized protein n=1 Tax=Sporolactobacillus inulinus CASD TaxID=1069536 RepID=A0A0U1QND5_9BACL|nr:hypothetical protein [Sporolactobacillus inulinus]KLI02320.1 hypothetical protein SINU_08615 [Sporolactobacillus inulinus CASD]GEB75659.1 hypothetical protein SIN01_00040 [Sporolactobacillus inulinus]
MLDELSQLVGRSFKPHELDHLCAKITGGKLEFKRMYWEEIALLETMSYRADSGITYVIAFHLDQDQGEYDSVLKVRHIDVLGRSRHAANHVQLFVLLLVVLVCSITVYVLFTLFK